MQKILVLIFTLFVFYSCSKSESSDVESNGLKFSSTTDIIGEFSDGDYCAEVEYYNPNTRTESSYTLTVEVSNNEIVKIDFPNGGYMDDEISDGTLDSSGEAKFTNHKGYQYRVKVVGDAGGCFESVPMAERCQGIT